ncbi:MAG: ABC transporter ATP-binding protein [Methylococcaceae bacterium]|nr:ABC transporter ATP-binding protein [Methylococcaceae bacterium]
MSHIHIDIRKKTYPARDGSGEHLAIRDLHFELAAGEFVCLVGPSGCGKTTLLNLIAGLDRHFEGSIRADEGAATLRIAYMFQNPRLLPWRTVRENIQLALPKGEGREWVDHLLEVMGLTASQNQYPQRLSLGMSRRVALVRAFAIRPSLLLMDEPLVSVDAPTARRIRQLLVRVWQERPHSVLFVTHDLREAIALADRLIFLSAPPTALLHEVTVDIPRGEREDETAVEAFRRRLIGEHQQIRDLL